MPLRCGFLILHQFPRRQLHDMIAAALGGLTPARAQTSRAAMQAGLSVGSTMVKEIKSLRKQADKAEWIAQAVADVEMSQRYMSMARAYRSQADILKARGKPRSKWTNLATFTLRPN